MQYASMSQRANLLPFISRRAHIRRDWCELMKRQMKNEMRTKRMRPTATLGVTVGNSCGGVDNSGDMVVSFASQMPMQTATSPLFYYKYRAADVTPDNAKIEQQFLCANIHTDVEYDHELVKRMRVVNLNAMTCLKMPLGFTRFFSYFNVGNISNAGRIMNKTHSMRESFICDTANSTKRIIRWINENIKKPPPPPPPPNLPTKDEKSEKVENSKVLITTRPSTTTTRAVYASGVIFAINEMPVLCCERLHLSFDRYFDLVAAVRNDRSGHDILYFWKIFRDLKYIEPGLVITVTQLTSTTSRLTDQQSTTNSIGYFVNIRLTNGIPTCPVTLKYKVVASASEFRGLTQTEMQKKQTRTFEVGYRIPTINSDNDSALVAAASYCEICRNYYPSDGLSMSFAVSSDVRDNGDNNNSAGTTNRNAQLSPPTLHALPRCRQHVWCSRHELTLYELSVLATKTTDTKDNNENNSNNNNNSSSNNNDYDDNDDKAKLAGTVMLARPKLHELACHGLLSVAAYPYATDISKLIVAINAHKRALEVRSACTLYDTTEEEIHPRRKAEMLERPEMQTYLNFCADRAWDAFDQNGKTTRLYLETLSRSYVLTSRDDNDKAIVHAYSSVSNRPPPTVADRLIPRNAVRLLFAFGDVNMMNCEDGYVLSDRLRLLADTTMCRKISFFCKSRISFLSRMTLEYTNDIGARVHVGTFIAFESPIRFFNICDNAQVYQRSADVFSSSSSSSSSSSPSPQAAPRYIYEVYILWNASFVQRAFDECGIVEATTVRREIEPCGDGTATTEPTNHIYISSHSSSAARTILLREIREYSTNPIKESAIELRTRCVRVTLRVRAVRQTLKLQNSFGQKGIAHYADLSDLHTDQGEPVDLISSMYSLLGRFACGQLMEQRHEGLRYIFSRRTGMCVGAGGYGYFFVSDDSAHNNFIYSTKHRGENPMRVCKLTYDSFLENGLSSSALVKSSEFESSITNPYAGIPRNVVRALECYGLYGRDLCLTSQTLLNLRQKLHNKFIINSIEEAMAATSAKKRRSGSRKRKSPNLTYDYCAAESVVSEGTARNCIICKRNKITT